VAVSRLTGIEMESEIRAEFQCARAIRARKAIFGRVSRDSRGEWRGAGIELDDKLDERLRDVFPFVRGARVNLLYARRLISP